MSNKTNHIPESQDDSFGARYDRIMMRIEQHALAYFDEHHTRDGGMETLTKAASLVVLRNKNWPEALQQVEEAQTNNKISDLVTEITKDLLHYAETGLAANNNGPSTTVNPQNTKVEQVQSNNIKNQKG